MKGEGIIGRVSMVFFGVLILMLAEGALRLFWNPPPDLGYEEVWTKIDPYRVKGDHAETSTDYLGAFRSVRFPVKKEKGEVRIICLGGSTTAGYPYDGDTSWPAALERRLTAVYPGERPRVINAGGLSYGSGRTLGVMRGILKYDPDVVIVASGDSEFGEDAYRTSLRRLRPSERYFHSLALSKLIKKVIPSGGKRPAVVSVEELGTEEFFFAPVLHGTVYSPDSERREDVFRQFRENLAGMVNLARDQGVALVLCTLPSNVADWPPDPDRRLPDNPESRDLWVRAAQKGRVLAREGRLEEAAGSYAEAAEIWQGNASFNFEYGTVLLRLGDEVRAREYLERARDPDPTPVRASTKFNGAVRDMAAGSDVFLADVEASFQLSSPGKMPGSDLILDNAHPTHKGHLLMALEVWKTLSRAVTPWGAYDPEAASEQLKAEKEESVKEPRFNPDLAFIWGQIFLRKGMQDRAIELFRLAIKLGYEMPYAEMNIAIALVEMGKYLDAVMILERLSTHHPDFHEPYPLLATAYHRLGNGDKAIEHYRRSLDVGAGGRELYMSLAALLAEEERVEEARETLAGGRAAYPGDCDLSSLEMEILQQEQPELAMKGFSEIVSRDPSCNRAWENLGILQMERGQWKDAVSTFSAAVAGPGKIYPLHHFNLGVAYYRGLRDPGRALPHFREYLRLQPEGVGRVPLALRREAAAEEGSSQ